MAINVAEITSILKDEIRNFEQNVSVSDVGTVVEVGDGIARIYGLKNAMAGELLEFQNGAMGQVFNLEEDSIGSVVFGDYLGIKEGDTVKTTSRLLEVPVGDAASNCRRICSSWNRTLASISLSCTRRTRPPMIDSSTYW